MINGHKNSPKKCPRKVTQKCPWKSTKCDQKCPRNVTKSVHEMSPIMSMRCLPPIHTYLLILTQEIRKIRHVYSWANGKMPVWQNSVHSDWKRKKCGTISPHKIVFITKHKLFCHILNSFWLDGWHVTYFYVLNWYIPIRPQNFEKSSPYFWLALHRTKFCGLLRIYELYRPWFELVMQM